MFETEGSVYATAFGYLAAVLLNLYVITYFTGYRYSLTIRRSVLITVFFDNNGTGCLGHEQFIIAMAYNGRALPGDFDRGRLCNFWSAHLCGSFLEKANLPIVCSVPGSIG
ncbi:hypothetical protein RCO48_24615 [Peribacillus frigoritolerans]|nr:hypothetical protein [Peribacillus frigoritolerans]